MKQYKEMALKALRQMKGDDFNRAWAAFRNCTSAEMQQEYGKSGNTRAQILREYKEHDALVDRAIDWLKTVKV